MPQEGQKRHAGKRKVAAAVRVEAVLERALRTAETGFDRAFRDVERGRDFADAHFEVVVHEDALALHIGQGGGEFCGQTAVFVAVEHAVREDLRRAFHERRGLSLYGSAALRGGAAQTGGGAHRPERKIIVVFECAKAAQQLAEDFSFGFGGAARVLQHFQAVIVNARLHGEEQFLLRLCVALSTARKQAARVLVQHSRSLLVRPVCRITFLFILQYSLRKNQCQTLNRKVRRKFTGTEKYPPRFERRVGKVRD